MHALSWTTLSKLASIRVPLTTSSKCCKASKFLPLATPTSKPYSPLLSDSITSFISNLITRPTQKTPPALPHMPRPSPLPQPSANLTPTRWKLTTSPFLRSSSTPLPKRSADKTTTTNDTSITRPTTGGVLAPTISSTNGAATTITTATATTTMTGLTSRNCRLQNGSISS